jgi:hypothetical protein
MANGYGPADSPSTILTKELTNGIRQLFPLDNLIACGIQFQAIKANKGLD